MNRSAVIAFNLVLSFLGVTSAMATEEAKYTVTRQEGVIEIRDYEAHILAETQVDGSLENASSKAFSRLFNYISGDNQSRNKVAMTAPVSQSPASEKISMTAPVGQQGSGNRWVVSFMMPASYTLNTLPKPNDAKVTLRLVPAQRVAAIRYSGLWSEKRYQEHKTQLEAWIAKNKLVINGEASWARYDPPFMPWFMRRNEILIPVTAR